MNFGKLAFVSGVLIIGTGCGGFTGGYPSGSLYTGVTAPHGVDRAEISGTGKTGDKAGEACATGILGVAACHCGEPGQACRAWRRRPRREGPQVGLPMQATGAPVQA